MTEVHRPIIKEGSQVIHSSGCYSDYYIVGTYKALKDINTTNLLIDFELENPRKKTLDWHKREVLCWEDPKFVEWLVNRGLLEKADSYEIHVGEYSKVKPEDIRVHEND